MNIILIGKPGSGKGTISQELIKSGDFIHLSTGDLLREEVASKSELGVKIDNLISKGNFVSDEMIFDMTENFLNNNKDKNIIFDGFPRTLKQAHVFKEKYKIDLVVYLDISDDTIINRICNRLVHEKSGRVYNKLTSPPKIENVDDITGEPLSQRSDDHIDKISKRLENFNINTLPIINYFKNMENRNFKILEFNETNDLETQISMIKSNLNKKNNFKL